MSMYSLSITELYLPTNLFNPNRLTSDATHDRRVADVNDDAFGGALDGVRRKESQVLRLQWVLVGEFRSQCLRLRLAGERRIVDLV